MLSKEFIAKFIAEQIKPNSVLALGTSKPSLLLLKELALHNIIKDLNIKIVPTSIDIAKLANEFNLKTSSVNNNIDLCIDFADYADNSYNYIKTHAHSLIRDKMIARYSEKCYIFVDINSYNKNFPLIPLEVSRFGTKQIQDELFCFGDTKIREKNNQKVRTLESNYILDLNLNKKYFDYQDLDFKLKDVPGILETGLFYNFADRLYIVNDKKIKLELNNIRFEN